MASGTRTYYYKNGIKKQEYTFYQGYKKGKYTLFYPNGIMQETGFYNGKKLYRVQHLYHPNGQLKQIASYKYNMLHGVVKKYDKNGILQFFGFYAKNELVDILSTCKNEAQFDKSLDAIRRQKLNDKIKAIRHQRIPNPQRAQKLVQTFHQRPHPYPGCHHRTALQFKERE